MMPTVGLELLAHGFPRLSFGTKLLRGDSNNITFVKRSYANKHHIPDSMLTLGQRWHKVSPLARRGH